MIVPSAAALKFEDKLRDAACEVPAILMTRRVFR